MTQEAPRLTDVAKLAKVSPATVSRTLNHPELVSTETLAKVQKAVNQIGYVVNESARSLRQKKGNALLVMVPAVSTPLFSQILSGMEKTAAKYDYSILIAHTEDTMGNTRSLLNYIHYNRTCGTLILGGEEPYQRLIKAIRGTLPPVVAVNEQIEDSSIPTIAIDGFNASREIASYLTGLGHCNIGLVSGPDGFVSSARERRAGFLYQLKNKNLAPVWEYATNYNMESGVMAANSWIALGNKPSAVFCSCDEVAFGFISQVQRKGFQVPGDVSIVGFDDIPLAGFSVPSLTTYHQPHSKIGEMAVTTLVEKIANPDKPTDSVLLKGELIIRESTRRFSEARTS